MSRLMGRCGYGRFVGPMLLNRYRDWRNVIWYNWNDTADTQEKEDEVTRVLNVNHNLYLNSRDHHTDDYDPRYFAVRRGQTFDLDIKLSQEYSVERDDIRLIFKFGKAPLISKGTDIELFLSTKEPFRNWNATVVSKDGNTIKVRVITPADCYVGKWMLQVHTVVKDGESITVHKYNHEPKIYVLFNPWCKDDAVYMPEADRRGEYVLNDTGMVFAGGSGYRPGSRSWNFGQFEDLVLDCAMYLLDEKSKMKDTVRGNPINITRKISALVNSQDDDGVLSGNWSGDYSGGTSPLKWAGSEAIINAYYRDKEPVRFGQCWVFSSVVTTLCRTLGIPCRSVTNYSSAHDTDASVTIDTYFDEEGEPIEDMNYDSVWNFHVWNDVWMTRPDLPEGYGGWQAIDATPQETSDGVYCMGPMSLRAIKEGEINLPYDGAFVFAEVNGDRVDWIVRKDGSLKMVKCKQNGVGTCIASKMVGQNKMEDVTGDYKYSEYGSTSQDNRAAVKKANLRGVCHEDFDDKQIKDVKLKIKLSEKVPEVGEPIVLPLEFHNKSTEKRTVKGKLRVTSQFYTGIVYRHIETFVIETELQPGEDKTIVEEVTADKYFKHLADHCPIQITCFVNVKETSQPISKQRDLHLSKPTLYIKALDTCTVGKRVEVKVSFTNKLDVSLTDCELRIEGPGLTKTQTRKIKEKVAARGTFNDTFDITPTKAGVRELVVIFNSFELLSIDAAHKFIVKE